MSKPFVTTPERRANLIKLARFLYTEPIEATRFDMGDFCSSSETAVEIKGCNTAGCAAGWGPNAGIAHLPSEEWDEYTSRVFIPYDNLNKQAWWWCFSGGWASYDNTPKGAAKRILWLLLGNVDLTEWTFKSGYEDYEDFEPTESDWSTAAA